MHGGHNETMSILRDASRPIKNRTRQRCCVTCTRVYVFSSRGTGTAAHNGDRRMNNIILCSTTGVLDDADYADAAVDRVRPIRRSRAADAEASPRYRNEYYDRACGVDRRPVRCRDVSYASAAGSVPSDNTQRYK